jgi:hypothetical protein
MDKIIELFIAIIGILFIVTKNEVFFASSHRLTLFLTMFLFNLLFDIVNLMRQYKPIKSSLIMYNIKQTCVGFVLYFVLFDTLSLIPELNGITKNVFLSIIIAIITKHSNKYYNFSHF